MLTHRPHTMPAVPGQYQRTCVSLSASTSACSAAGLSSAVTTSLAIMGSYNVPTVSPCEHVRKPRGVGVQVGMARGQGREETPP